MIAKSPRPDERGGDPKGGYAVAVLLCVAAGAIQYSLQPVIGRRLPFAIFSVAVVTTAWIGGSGPGLLATLLGTIAGVLLAANQTVGVDGHPPATVFGLVAFALMGVLVSLATRGLHRRALAERRARREAERTLKHTTHLQELTAALSRAKTPAEVRRAALVELTHASAADTAVFALSSDDGTTYDVAAAIGTSEQVVSRSTAMPMTARTPLTEAIRRQELIVLDSPTVGDLEHPDRKSDPILSACEAVVVVPLLRAGRAFGAIALSFDRPRTFEGDERQFLWAAASRVTQAIDRAQVYETTEHARAAAEAFRTRADAELRERQRAEELLRDSEAKYRALATRTNRLYELNAGLSEAVSVNAVARVIVHQGKAVVGSSAASVAIVVDGGRSFQTLYSEDLPREVADSWQRFRASDGLLSTKALHTRQPVFVTSFAEWQKQFPGSAAAAADGGYASSASLPLLIENSVVGVLTLNFTAPVNFDAGYTALLRSVAQHCAQALDRACTNRRRLPARPPKKPIDRKTSFSRPSRTSCARRSTRCWGGPRCSRTGRSTPAARRVPSRRCSTTRPGRPISSRNCWMSRASWPDAPRSIHSHSTLRTTCGAPSRPSCPWRTPRAWMSAPRRWRRSPFAPIPGGSSRSF